MKTVKCDSSGCVNENISIGIHSWDGSEIVCGVCGALLTGQAEWYEPPSLESSGMKPAPQQAVDLIAAMSEQERAELAQLIAPPAPTLGQTRKP